MFNEIGLRMAILFLFAIKILTWLLDSEIAWFVGRITTCKPCHTLLSAVSKQRFVIIWTCWTTNAPWTWGTNPLGAKITKNKRPIQQDQEKELAKRFGLPCPCPDPVRWLNSFRRFCWLSLTVRGQSNSLLLNKSLVCQAIDQHNHSEN